MKIFQVIKKVQCPGKCYVSISASEKFNPVYFMISDENVYQTSINMLEDMHESFKNPEQYILNSDVRENYPNIYRLLSEELSSARKLLEAAV